MSNNSDKNTNIVTKLVPYSYLNAGFQAHIAENSHPESFKSGDIICQQGDIADCVLFLLKGKVKTTLANGKSSERGPSSLPITQGYQQHNYQIDALENCLVLNVHLSPKEQDQLICWDFAASCQEQPEWFSKVKDCEMFDHIPGHNLLRLANAFEEKNMSEGDLVIQEDHYENEFYVLLEGEVNVFQGEVTDSSPPIATIPAPSTFGESGLMEDLPRTASIKMASDGKLRVFNASKMMDFFEGSVSESNYASRKDLKSLVAEQGYKLLDIRPQKEIKLNPVKGAQIASIDSAQDLINSIEPEGKYLLYSPYEMLNELIFDYLSSRSSQLKILQ